MKREIKAAIFDMDGTLIDSMKQWRLLNSEFVQGLGIVPTPQEEKELYSMSGIMAISYFKEKYGIETDFDTLGAMSFQKMEPVYEAGVPLKPGAGELLTRLHQKGIKCVIATATPARLALIALNRTNLVKDLDYIYSIDMIGCHKNEPEFFERLSGRIGVPKEECVMFEDSLYAMKGARAAGLLGVIGITDSTNVTDIDEIRKVCDRVVDSYDELK